MKSLIIKQDTSLILNKSNSTRSITSRILSGKTSLTTEITEEWIKEIWIWADENNISDLEREEDIFSEYCKGLPRDKDQLLTLTTLNLYNNKLTDIPKGIGNLKNLTHLNLGANKLTKLPKEIGNLLNLTEFHLWNNQLIALPKEIGNLSNLIKLNLENNPLVELPKEIENLSNLLEFSIRYIDELILTEEQEKWISILINNNCAIGLSGTKYNINFFRKINAIEYPQNKDLIDDSWMNRLWEWADENNIPDLEWVEDEDGDDGGFYEGFPRDKKTLLNFTKLNLGENELTELPKEIGNLTNLTTLSLTGSELTELPKEIGNLTNLTKLYLYRNKLTELQSEWIKRLEAQGCTIINF